jgi:DNA-directed RNA polymerase subunit F
MPLNDTISPLLEGILRDVRSLSGLEGTAVAESQQIAGTLEQRQEPPLSDRISDSRAGAEVQRKLEAAKAKEAVTEDLTNVEEMSNAVAAQYADELVRKFLSSLGL